MNKYRNIAITVMILSLILSFWLYGTEYSTPFEPQKISERLTEYIFKDDVQVQVIEIKKIGNRMLVTFTDERYENFMGFAVFKRGLNLRWLPLSADYGESISVEAFSFSVDNKDYVAICGVNSNPNIAAYEYITTDSNPKILYSNNVSSLNFIDVYENKLGYWSRLRLLDSNGNNFTLALHKATNHAIPSASVGTAEVFMINVFCFLIIIMGFIIARFFWRYRTEDENKELTTE